MPTIKYKRKTIKLPYTKKGKATANKLKLKIKKKRYGLKRTYILKQKKRRY
jgi:hypothetical protein